MYPSCTFDGRCVRDLPALLPVLAAAAALALDLLVLLLRLWRAAGPAKARRAQQRGSVRAWGAAGVARRHVARAGGAAVLACKAAQLAGLAALHSLVVASAAASAWRVVDVVLAEVTALALVLALANVFVPARTALVLSPHLTVIALGVFATYAYRDLWPLATYTTSPADAAEGALLWVKVALAACTGVLVPVLEPHPYLPLHPEHAARANPEQTASLFARAFFTFLDPVLWRAARAPLAHTDLPPLADADHAAHLVAQSAPHLDPRGGGHRSLLGALLRVHRAAVGQQVLCILGTAAVRLASPTAVHRLLSALEPGAAPAVRPAVWVAALALAPVADSLLRQQSAFIATRALARLEAVLTVRVFECALRTGVRAASASSASDAADKAAGKNVEDKTGEDDKRADGVGRIVNLATGDLDALLGARDVLVLCIGIPAELTAALAFQYAVLGWSALVGCAVLAALSALFARLAQRLSAAQRAKMCATDARVQLSAEALAVVRTVKMLGWTPRVRATLQGARARELRWVWRRLVLGFVSFNANQLVPVLCMVATYSTYTLAMHRSLTAAVVFSSLTVFGNIRVLLDRASSLLGPATAAYTSLGRLQEFLEKSERLPDAPDDGRGDVVGFGGVVFAWDPPAPTSPASASPPVAPPAAPPTPTLAASATIPAAPPAEQAEQAPPAPPQRGYTLRAARAVRFARGALNVVCGPTGAGKTSLLLALLGEMPVLPYPGRQEGEEGRQEGEEGWVSLPRAGGVAYAAQETWVLSATVRENIVFGAEYDEARYRAVIRACALERDLQMFEEGDGTQVGERGVTLSGGQKARITLARAVYSSAETLLLDDVLAALDVQTARWVVDACFMGELMKGRTVILVTHNVALTAPLAALVVSVDASGAVTCQDGASFARAAPGPAPEGATHRAHRSATLDAWDAGAPPEPNDKARASSGEDRTRAAPEEVALGRVNRAAYGMYLRATGGALHWAGYIGAETAAQACSVLQTWWLGWWARQYAGGARVDAPYYIAVYAAVVGATLVFFLTQSLADSLGRLRASRAIHRQLVDSVLGATFRWLDTTPTSRILTRFTQDIQAVDGAVPQAINILTNTFLGMALKFAAVFAYAPILLLPSLLVVGLGACLGSVYIRAQLAVKRELAARKAPVLAVLGGAVHGLVSIRAYSAQGLFRRMLLQRVDEYTRVSRTFWSLNQWIAVRLDTLSALFAATVAWYLVYVSSIGPSGVGFVLAMAVSFTDLVLRLVNWYNQLEVNANSLERLDQYIHIEQEPTDGEEPPAYWPASGELHVERLTASYAPDGPKVLRDISFDVQSGERVGIVGRTGAGKSTLTLALLRCIHVEGLVAFDGIPIHTIPLDKLRQSITIIPQVPELLSGTLRYNLDPSDELDDKTLYDALRSAGMFSLQEASDINRVTLDTKIIGSGSNFSVGQRQIIALARAIVRGSRLLILDEATSAIDHRTDAVIQKSLRDEMKGVSVITVAHRLQTVMDYDKIMVLDAGRLVEFDTPRALLEKEGGMFRALVESSHSRDALYAAAYGHSHGSTA